MLLLPTESMAALQKLLPGTEGFVNWNCGWYLTEFSVSTGYSWYLTLSPVSHEVTFAGHAIRTARQS